MLNFSGLTRYPKKSKTLDQYKEPETNFLHDCDKVFDIFCCDNKQRKPYEIIYGLRITFNDHAFLKIKKQSPRLHALKNFSTLQPFTSNIELNLFLISMLLQKQRNLCHRVQYILYLQYNKQWYQIFH